MEPGEHAHPAIVNNTSPKKAAESALTLASESNGNLWLLDRLDVRRTNL